MSTIYAVIMAGGSGTRFWPLSRQRKPKQVLSILGPNSLLQDTFDRLKGLVPSEQILVVTNRQQYRVIAPQLPQLPERNFLLEPTPRNTAACIGLAAVHIQRVQPDAAMVVLPSDHLIGEVPEFQRAVRTGLELVERFDPLVTIGIRPSRPETGYGYIQFIPTEPGLPEGVHRVKTFAEKPNLSTARLFLKSGDFFWNSGIFIWRAARILAEMEELLPDHYHQLEHIRDAIDTVSYRRVLISRYRRLRPISIDYGIMEKSDSRIYMVEGKFTWSDVGSWDELYRISPKEKDGNVVVGEVATLDARGNLIYSPDRLTAVIGLEDVLVVNTPSATLICPRERAQDVKEMVEKLRQENRDKYL